MEAEIARHVQEETTPPSSPHQALFERQCRDKCFKCGNLGHWARDCPSTTPTKKPSYFPDGHRFPVLNCRCGVACTLRVSQKDTSYGRMYYSRNCDCPSKFNKWCDEVEAPLCECGAGACTINFREGSNGNYIKFYTCRIRTGHGACGFLHFDNPPNSWPMEIDKLLSRWSPPQGDPPNIKRYEDECSVPDSSNGNVVVNEAETSDFVLGEGYCVSSLMSRSAIRSRQMEFEKQISAAENSPDGCKAHQIMGLHVYGWVGRLAFPPPRILADPPLQHFFRCMFPLFDPKLVSEYANASDSGSSSTIPHVDSNAVPLGTSGQKRSFTAMQGGTNPALKEVGKNLPKDLSLLVSMEPSSHNTILLATNNTFDALSSPSIECESFTECLMKSIQCLSSVTEMELSIQDKCNQQVPYIEKVSSNYLESVSQIKEMLQKMGKLETFVLNFAKDVRLSMRTMEASYQELTKALKLPQEEVEQCMAGTALDKTRRKQETEDGRFTSMNQCNV